MKELKVADFRQNLKEYMQAAAECPTVYQIGRGKEVLLVSEATIQLLEIRHYFNLCMRDDFESLKLDKYITIANGTKTKDLPIDVMIKLTQFFGLVKKMLDYLAIPNAKENAIYWDVSEYIRSALEGKELEKSGKFSKVYDIMELLNPKMFEGKVSITLEAFFEIIFQYLDNEKNEKPFTEESLTSDQILMLRTIIKEVSAWCVRLLNYQSLSNIQKDPECSGIQTERIFDWYADYIV